MASLAFALLCALTFLHQNALVRGSDYVPTKAPVTKCVVEVTTGTGPDAKTDGEVYIVFHGPYDKKEKVYLDDKDKNDFEAGQTDSFNLYLDYSLFPLSYISMGRDPDKDMYRTTPGWLLHSVKLICSEKSINWYFPVNVKIGTKYGKLEVDLKMEDIQQYKTATVSPPPAPTCVLEVTTGTGPDAKTDGEVYIVLHGPYDKKEKQYLRNVYMDDFEEGKTDSFNLYLDDSLFPLSYISMGRDPDIDLYKPTQGWLLHSVKLVCTEKYIYWSFPVDVKIGSKYSKLEIDLKY